MEDLVGDGLHAHGGREPCLSRPREDCTRGVPLPPFSVRSCGDRTPGTRSSAGRATGQLSICAGTSQPGIAGVGGPAVDARLPVYFGSQLAVAHEGTVYVTGGTPCG